VRRLVVPGGVARRAGGQVAVRWLRADQRCRAGEGPLWSPGVAITVGFITLAGIISALVLLKRAGVPFVLRRRWFSVSWGIEDRGWRRRVMRDVLWIRRAR
jgi:hypothetical protein